MIALLRTSIACLFASFLASCAVPLSQELAGRPIPSVAAQTESKGVEILFSADKKYETANGVPLPGDPLVCREGRVLRVNGASNLANRTTVAPAEEVAVTSVIAWVNTGFRKVCGPFVAFTPEPNATYVVVNERIGGKGMSALWTGMARQTCAVSVYRESSTGFTRVPVRAVKPGECRVPEV